MGAEGQPRPGGRKKFLWHIRWAGGGGGPHVPVGPVPRGASGGAAPLRLPTHGAAPTGNPGTCVCGDAGCHWGGTRVCRVPAHPKLLGRSVPEPGGWCRAVVSSQVPSAAGSGESEGPDPQPRRPATRGSPIPVAPPGHRPPGKPAGSRAAAGGAPAPEPPEPGRAAVTGRLGCLPAQCHRPVGARVLAGRVLSRPRGCLPAPSRAGCAPGPSTPCAGTRAAWSGWGSWKSGSGPCPAPGVAPPAGGSRGPAGSRGGGALPGLGAVGPAGSADFWRRGWGGQRMFPTAADGGGAVLAGQGGPASALPRPGRRCRVCCADKGGLFQRSVHSGEGPPGRLCRGVCVPTRAGRAVPPAARGAPRPAPERGRGSRYSVRQFDL